MLWDLIRDFFVEHVFGGYASDNSYHYGLLGDFVYENDGSFSNEGVNGADLYFSIGHGYNGENYAISFSDWLSTTATAISITIIVVLCCLFVYKIIKLIGGLIR